MYGSRVEHVGFVGASRGRWRVTSMRTLLGPDLAEVSHLDVRAGADLDPLAEGARWILWGSAGHARYVERLEKTRLDPVSPALGRPEARVAVLIPIRKSPAWWALPQDERRAIFEGRSRHIADSLPLLPRVARRLLHARELGEPFDFLTWFEMAPEHVGAFDGLLEQMRGREEWGYVDREVELRLELDVPGSGP